MFHKKFNEIANLYPDNPAIFWEGNIISYRELNNLSDEIAKTLIADGIKTGSIVPMQLKRGPLLIAYSLGIMKAGAIYVPISSDTPPSRLEYILNDIKKEPLTDDAIAIYYTSGSTGMPKGVVLSHSNILAFCKMHAELFAFSNNTRSGIQADVGFDSFILLTFPTLYSGGTIYLMNEIERISLIGMHRFLMKNKIDMLFLTTQFAVEYMKGFDNKYLKTLLLGGEAIHTYVPRSYEVYNLYGPTECTVYVTAYKLKAGDAGDIPIGVPTGLNRIYLVNDEICISSPQVALSYLGRPDETAQKFVPNPYYDPNTDDSCYCLMYRTGDLAKWSDNGELLFRGRIDKMVKISGYRIELGEIEIALLKHSDISAACVIARQNNNDEAFLVAYLVPRTGSIDIDAIKVFLLQSLPSYMIPRKFMVLEYLPLDKRTNKVDISSLPL